MDASRGGVAIAANHSGRLTLVEANQRPGSKGVERPRPNRGKAHFSSHSRVPVPQLATTCRSVSQAPFAQCNRPGESVRWGALGAHGTSAMVLWQREDSGDFMPFAPLIRLGKCCFRHEKMRNEAVQYLFHVFRAVRVQEVWWVRCKVL